MSLKDAFSDPPALIDRHMAPHSSVGLAVYVAQQASYSRKEKTHMRCHPRQGVWCCYKGGGRLSSQLRDHDDTHGQTVANTNKKERQHSAGTHTRLMSMITCRVQAVGASAGASMPRTTRGGRQRRAPCPCSPRPARLSPGGSCQRQTAPPRSHRWTCTRPGRQPGWWTPAS